MEGGKHVASRYDDWPSSVQSLLSTVVIAIFVITFAVQAFQIPSESMENTLLIGDYLLVDKLRYGNRKDGFWEYLMPYRPVRRGDVIVFHYPVNPSEHFVKRVVGVPGDRIRLVNRELFVNGVSQHEVYVRYSSSLHDVFRDEFPVHAFLTWRHREGRWLFSSGKQSCADGSPGGGQKENGDSRFSHHEWRISY